MKTPWIAAAVLGVGVVLSGCGGDSPAPAETSLASESAVETLPVSADQPCDLLTADEINAVLGTDFPDGEQTEDEAREVVNCRYTITDSSSGVEVPVAVVLAAVSLADGQESYDLNVELAPAYFGGDAEPIEVVGADQAYAVTDETTGGPVIGVLVGDQFMQVQVGVDGATVEQGRQLAAIMAGKVA